MSSEPNLQSLFSTFIGDENAALETGRQGQFWPANHSLIKAAVFEADKHLPPAAREELYFHYMRLSGAIPAVSDRELSHLVAAYRKLIPLLDTSQAGLTRRHGLLFSFGFDGEGALPDGLTASSRQLKDYTKLVAQCLKYTSLPAQRDKIKNFGALAHHGERLYQTLRHLGYCHDRRYGPENYGASDLLFWGMVLVILLHEGRRADLVRDFLEGDYPIPQRDKHLALLHPAVQAVLSAFQPADARFRDLAGRLASLQREREASTESAAFARALSLPFGDGENWQMQILIPTDANKNSPYLAPHLICEISSNPDYQWQIQYIAENGNRFSERPGRVLQNDLAIDGMGAGNLLSLPQWLNGAEKKLGIRFERERALVKCGRHRAAAKRIMEWLAG